MSNRESLIKQQAALSEAKRKLLEKWIRGDQAAESPIPRRAKSESVPLSFAQERLWFLHQLDPASTAYNICARLQLTGALDVRALRHALSEILRRHEVLRAAFKSIRGEPLQVISEATEVALPMIDLSEFNDPGIEVERIAKTEAERPFVLGDGGLIRGVLVRLAEEEHVLVLAMHHIISDGWSRGILIKEATALYQSYHQGRASELPELPLQYGDYATWQRKQLQGERLEKELAYWREQLGDESEVLELPVDYPRQAVRSYGGGSERWQLGRELSEQLRELSRSEGMTMYMLLLAAFQTLLWRYSGQQRISVGTVVANRPRVELEGLIGFFVNTLVLRTDFAGRPSFRELLGRVRDVCLGAYSHEEVPFEKLVEELAPEREMSQTPLFQVMFIYQNLPRTEVELSGLRLRALGGESETAKFDLTLVMNENREGLQAVLEYNRDLFVPATIVRMAEHYQLLLEGLVADPARQLFEISLTTDAERLLLQQWNDTGAAYPQELSLSELLEAQAERTPYAIAIACEDEEIDYQELHRRGNQLAQYLQKLGVHSEVKVGIYVERSIEMVIGLLGILKAGGVYVPLDPTYPRGRLSFMLQDSQVAVLVTQQHLVESLSPHDAQVVRLDSDWATIASESSERPASGTLPDNLVYLIYTSGSTGVPKGVQITNRSVVSFLTCMGRKLAVTQRDTLLSVTTLSFDIAALEIFLPLTIGARLIVTRREDAADGVRLAEKLTASRATMMQATPATWRLLVESGWKGDHSLKMLCGGEALSRELASKLIGKGVTLWNLYGPTETTIWSASCEINSSDNPVYLGQPIDNTQIYVVDAELQLASLGVAGELCIGGVGLARGYLNQPSMTAEKFVPDPFSSQPDARMYRTGDRARFRASGELEFLGRRDYQVKLRGHRIELGEIEMVLRRHPAVREAVVELDDCRPGDQRLVAYVACEEESTSVSAVDLRRHVTGHLPQYMIPASIVKVLSLPLTLNGKLDRRKLATLERTAEPAQPVSLAAVRTPIEEVVAETMLEVLGIERIGVDDSFFELGGHSLLATRVIGRLQEAFQIELPLRLLFETPNVAGLARHIETAIREGKGLRVPPIERVPRDERLPLSFAQQRLWFLDQLEPGNPVYNIPTAVRIRGELNISALDRSLNEIVARHETLRTSLQTIDGEPFQVIAPIMTGVLRAVDLRELRSNERETLALQLAKEDASRPFDLAQGPLWRATLFRIEEQEHIVLLTLHHIVSDGWSTGVLIGELSALYEAFTDGQPSPLAPLSIQYADYAHWQRQWLQGDVLQAQLAYWKEKLDGSRPLLELPTDHPRPAIQTFRGARKSISLSRSLTNGVKSLCRRQQVTLFMALLAAFKTLLYRYSHQDDICVGSPIANRGTREVEALIGYIANTLVLRTDLSGNPSFIELLARVREGSLGAYTFQDISFEKLVDELQPARDLSYSPLFQVMFTLQNMPPRELKSSGLTLSPIGVDNRTAKFDLELVVIETANGMTATMEYNEDLFIGRTIGRMMDNFAVLLEKVVANPEQRIAEVPILNAREEQFLLELNQTDTPLPEELCAHRLFELQVERTPQAIAAIFHEAQWTYAELNERANRWARVLVENGVGPDVIVGVLCDRSLNLLTAMLAISKAGGVYLPLDPFHPVDRLRVELDQSACRVVLADRTYEPVFSSVRSNAQLITFETLLENIGPAHNLPALSTPQDLAYVIYTSGSTGIPKGAMIEHLGMVNHLIAKISDLHLTGADRVAQTASQCFDISVWQFVAPLLVGGLVHIFDDEVTHDAPRLLAETEEHGITILETVPSLLRAALDPAQESHPELSKLRWLVITGEALPPELCRQWLSIYPEIPLLNAYGPTECSDDVTHHEISSPPAEGLVRMPIGHAVQNMRLHVLDSRLSPAPIGVSGELYIGGTGVGRGYLHDPVRTAEAFVPDPFAVQPGERLYRSGDLVRYLPDGTVEFIGRRDQQMKIRGFRIELGEIEAAVNTLPGVRESLAVARQDTPGDKYLVLYLTFEPSATVPSTSELRNLLKQRVPDYMIPRTFVVLDEFPLTSNGKIDRKALPAPDGARPDLGQDFAPPSSLVEKKLARIWQQVLGLDQVGVHDNFFELGGDSILMIQIISRARRAGLSLTLRQVFQHQTIAELAQLPAMAHTIEAEQSMVTGQVPLTPPQHWFIDQNMIEPHHYNQAVLLELRQPMLPVLLKTVIDKLLVHHDGFRSRLIKDESGWRQYVTAEEDPRCLYVIDLSDLPLSLHRAAIQKASAQSQASLNLSEGPFVRFAFFDRGHEHAGRLLIVAHHLTIDGVSWRILLEDLQTAYDQLARKQEITLPPKTTSFKSWAERLTAHAQAEEVTSELRHWVTSPRRRSYPIPVDYPGRANTIGSAKSFTTALGTHDTQALLQTIPTAYNTRIDEALLTALVLTFARWTGRQRLLVDLEGHGREEIFSDVDLSRTVGWFTSIYPVLLDVGGASEPRTALKELKTQLREIPNRGLGYGMLRYLNADASIREQLRELPQAEVIFNYLGQFDQSFTESSYFKLAPESHGSSRSLRQARRHLLEVNGSVAGKELHVSWTYSEQLHRESTIRHLAHGYIDALQTLIAGANETEVFGLPGIPDVDLSRAKVDQILAELDVS